MVDVSHGIKISSNFMIFQDKKLGNGAFGKVYLGQNLRNGKDIAIKIESKKLRHPQLLHEAKILKEMQDEPGFPKVYYYTQLADCNCLVMDLLGKSLEGLFTLCERKFTVKTTVMIGLQLIDRVESLHNHCIIHRDMKPDNFLIGKGENKKIIYAIDMGLSKRYIDPKTGFHIPFKEGKSLTGTARYASIFTHLGMEQSRRDDLEGLAYVLIYFLKGVLPWQGQRAKTKSEKYRKIKEKKINISIDDLCSGLPANIKQFLDYARSLKFEEKPNYQTFKDLLNGIMKEYKLDNDYNYDWLGRENSISSTEASSNTPNDNNENKNP